MSNYSAILQAIESIQDANNRCYDDLKLVIAESIKGLRVENNADHFILNKTLTDLMQEIKIHNGRLNEVEVKLAAREIKSDNAIDEFHGYVKYIKWAKKNWYIIAGLFIISVGIVLIIFEIGAINKAINWLIDKI